MLPQRIELPTNKLSAERPAYPLRGSGNRSTVRMVFSVRPRCLYSYTSVEHGNGRLSPSSLPGP